jgi:hypothetical protein
MRKSFAFVALTVLSICVQPSLSSAQTFEKKNYNYSEWIKANSGGCLGNLKRHPWLP